MIRKPVELGIKGRATLTLSYKSRTIERPLRDIDAILVIGSKVKISSALPPVLASQNIPLSILAEDTVAILMNPVITRYNTYRIRQYTIEKCEALTIALEYIKAKITGMINILKYYRRRIPSIKEPPKPTGDTEKYETNIRIWESTASSTLWPELIAHLKEKYLKELHTKYNFRGRRPRHPDPFNKTLSVMYAVLYTLATKALIAAGLDPTYGFLHRTRYSTPLTFDYTEMFKPIAMQATIDLINHTGVPEIGEDGELTRETINKAIAKLYEYLTLKHKDIRRTPYQQIHLKAFCLAKYLEGKCRKERLTVAWNRALYRNHTKTSQTRLVEK